MGCIKLNNTILKQLLSTVDTILTDCDGFVESLFLFLSLCIVCIILCVERLYERYLIRRVYFT